MRQQMPARPPVSQAGNQLPSAPTHHQHHMFKCPYDTLCLVGGSVCPSVCIHERSTYCSCMLRTFHVLNVCLLFSLCTYTYTHTNNIYNRPDRKQRRQRCPNVRIGNWQFHAKSQKAIIKHIWRLYGSNWASPWGGWAVQAGRRKAIILNAPLQKTISSGSKWMLDFYITIFISN